MLPLGGGQLLLRDCSGTGEGEQAGHVLPPWKASNRGSGSPRDWKRQRGQSGVPPSFGERLFSREGVGGWGSLELFSTLCDSGGCVYAAHILVHRKS